jgi:2-polyprenyl-3-methyl-5-hydroxy-6-metoxy-1,4-benzoquinol methylase
MSSWRLKLVTPKSPSPYGYSFDPEGDSTAAKVIRMVGGDRDVLELGCGYGVMSRALHARGCRVVGLERDSQSAEAARPWLHELVIVDLEDQGWVEHLGHKAFDVVLAADVIEHLRHPGELLRRLHSLLSADGELVLSVPNIGHAGVIAELFCGAFDYRPTGILDSTHIRFFTWKTLEQLLNECGFEVVERATIDASGAHEHFFNYWISLPDPLREVLATHPTASVFQYVLKARKSSNPSPLATGDEDMLRAWVASVAAGTSRLGPSQEGQ